MAKSNKKAAILPIMFGFFIMGFVDIIGMTVNYVSSDFESLSGAMVSLLTSSCFVWFLILSVPTGLLMNRIGRKNTVLLSFLVQILAFSLIIVDYAFATVVVAFSLVGIGNTMLQVALNPLVTNVISPEKQTGVISIGQLAKALCSFTGPLLVSLFVGTSYGWKYIFPLYAAISLLGFVWLALTPVQREKPEDSGSSFAATFGLFRDKMILAFFVAILVLVGVDVGMNVTFPKYLQDTCGMDLDSAALCNSVYFLSRTIGALIGGVLLLRIAEERFYIVSVLLALAGLMMLVLVREKVLALIGVSVFGLGYSNLFAIVVSMAMKRKPERSNEISSLMIMGCAGGGILPPLIGIITDAAGNQWSAILVLAVVWIYMFTLTGKIKKINSNV